MTFLKRLVLVCAAAFTTMIAAEPVDAAETRFNRPKISGDRLDWCRVWAGECGKPAADAFCRAQGFEESTNFAKAENIGANSPTRLISTGAVCDQGFCDGFRFITCTKPGQKFVRPKFRGNRLDWCVNWAQGCGAPAANAFCQRRGYSRATNFVKAENIGDRRPTRLIGTGAVCDQEFCDGFRVIECE